LIGLQSGNDELLLEFTSSLTQGETTSVHLIDNLMQTAVEALFSHSRVSLLKKASPTLAQPEPEPKLWSGAT